MENLFEHQFKQLVNEDINQIETQTISDPLESSPENERRAFVKSLDEGSDPDDFDINPSSFKQITEDNLEEANKWIDILESFASSINDVDNKSSLNHFLNRVDREGSPFRGIVRSQSKRVTRIAEECDALGQVISSFVISSDKKKRELLQQFPNLSE